MGPSTPQPLSPSAPQHVRLLSHSATQLISPLVLILLLSPSALASWPLSSSTLRLNPSAPQPLSPLYLRGGSSALSRSEGRIEDSDTAVINPSSGGRYVREHKEKEARLQDFYEIREVLGEGGFATVHEGRHRLTGRRVAIKTIDLFKVQSDKLDMLRNEVDVMKMLDHPCIVRLYDTFEEEDKLHLVMELCTGGDLFDFLMKTNIEESGEKTWDDGSGVQYTLTEKSLSALVFRMLRATNYMHQKGIVHRDIKPENFLLETKATEDGPGEIKMIDFGFSKVFQGSGDMHNMLGSPYYVAPEVLKASDEKGYGKECDIWSLGVVVYTMLCGCPPFYGDDNQEIYRAIEKGEYDWPDDVTVSAEAKDFIDQLLNIDSVDRINASEALRHPWIAQNHALDDTPIARKMLSEFGKVKEIGKLKREALIAIGYSLDREAIRQMRSTFRAIDTTGKGIIKLADLQEAMKKHGMDEEQVEKMFLQLSAGNLDGEIDYTTFIAACLEKRSYLEHGNVYDAFHRFQDGTGCITSDSLRKILGEERFTVQEVEAMVKECDLDGDGKISFSEFMVMMGSRLPVSRLAWRVLPLLEGLSADEVSQVLSIATPRNFEAGEDLLQEGSEAHSFFLVEDGEVEVSRIRDNDPGILSRSGSVEEMAALISDLAVSQTTSETALENIAKTAAEGASHRQNSTKDVIVLLAAKTVVGEMEFVAKELRLATVTATTPVKALEVPYDALRELLDRDVSLGYKVMTNIARIAARGVAQMNKIFSNFGNVLDMYASSREYSSRRPPPAAET